MALVLLARAATAALVLEVGADSEIRGDTAVRVTATNVGDEPALALVPEATFLGTTVDGARLDELPLRFRHAWELTLPRPPGAGTFPLVVELRYADAFGHASSAPIVHVARTPGSAMPLLELSLDVEPVATAGRARARLANLDATPVEAALCVVAGVDLDVTPAEVPIALAARGTTDVALHLVNRGALPGSTVPVYAYATAARGDRHETVVASAGVAIVDASPVGLESPVVLVPVAATIVGGLLALAWRRTAHGTRPASRSARRRLG